MPNSNKRSVQFANFICHFGEKVLLDYLDEIVVPAFTGNFQRRYGKTAYFFYETELINIEKINGDIHPAIVGYFVKDTILTRENVYENGQLIKKPLTVPSAPSSIFVLILENHKLLYLPQEFGAPGLPQFKVTVEYFLKQARLRYIDDILKEKEKEYFPVLLNRLEKSKIRKNILETCHIPELEIVPLSSESSLEKFISEFKLLKKFTVKVLKTNHEINNDEFFENIRKQGDSIHANSGELTYRNSKGLLKEKVKTKAIDALDGNAEIILVGIDKEGHKLDGSNDKFSVKALLPKKITSLKQAARDMYSKFVEFVEKGNIIVSKTDEPANRSDQLIKLVDRIKEAKSHGTELQ